MLQYPVHLPPLSPSSSTDTSTTKSSANYKDTSDYFLHNDPHKISSPTSLIVNPKRFQKESPVNRSIPFPLSIATNLPPPTKSINNKPPHSSAVSDPSVRSRSPPRQSNPVAVPSHQQSRSQAFSSSSSVVSSATDDVLCPGDVVGEGFLLQGETIELVTKVSPDIAKEFEVVRRLGTGSYAVVYLVAEVLSRPPPSEDGHMSTIGSMEDLKSPRLPTTYGREFAVKCLSKANLDQEALAAQMSEVTIHQSLASHPNIATLHCTLETPSFLLILLEYVPGEDLFYFLEQARDHFESESPASSNSSLSRTPPTPSLLSNLHPSQLLSRTRLRLISSMFSQMCDAVAACHAQQVFHRDIKPENFIVTDGWSTLPDGRQERKVIVKLTDFGLSTTEMDSSDMDCGSAPYMSYECRNNVAPTYRPRAADVWSLGIVLINMLYHHNPWTDTAQDVCSSFDAFRADPVKFFISRFMGMTLPVAEFLANRVFCILEDANDDSQRVTASDFGAWAKDLPCLFNTPRVNRAVSISSQGHPIAVSTPASHRPCSRNPSGVSTVMRTPAVVPSRSLSRAPSLKPTYEQQEKFELSTVIDQVEEQVEPPEASQEIETESRSTSTNKRRRRGARKGKGGTATAPTSPIDDTLETLANASQTLAREISQASKASSRKANILKPSNVPPVPSIPVTKKPSKWRLGFGKGNGSAADRPSSDEGSSSAETSTNNGMSATASNVTNLIMGLSATSVHSPPKPNDDSATWGRGRRGRNPIYNRNPQGYSTSASPPAIVEQWVYSDRRSERAVSPNSMRSGRPLASSASSMASSNWRSSMSTASSAGTSTSAFTRFSNSSTRSISTTATSVSSAPSWRTNNKAPSTHSTTSYPTLPKNIKIMNGVPWELDQLPRGQIPNPVGDIFGSPPPRKQRPRKPNDLKLDTINERPAGMSNKSSPVYSRKDVSTSTSDLTGHGKEDGEPGVKKVQRGQINALAKMLSALRR
ncbi:kinase-like protein [Pluteus cervinus]|uniref:Kinase-like protein n=1 Tax=Pluteus cervinus TaxID=181527 RepID=A0ACD3BBY3_9AGAR|nr:kinase-like protein [Pluteus cervinus]